MLPPPPPIPPSIPPCINLTQRTGGRASQPNKCVAVTRVPEGSTSYTQLRSFYFSFSFILTLSLLFFLFLSFSVYLSIYLSSFFSNYYIIHLRINFNSLFIKILYITVCKNKKPSKRNHRTYGQSVSKRLFPGLFSGRRGNPSCPTPRKTGCVNPRVQS